MRFHDGTVTAPYSSSEMRELIAACTGHAVKQSQFSKWLNDGFVVSSARFADTPAFTEIDAAHNVRIVEKNYNAAAGVITRRRRKLAVQGNLGKHADAVRRTRADKHAASLDDPKQEVGEAKQE